MYSHRGIRRIRNAFIIIVVVVAVVVVVKIIICLLPAMRVK